MVHSGCADMISCFLEWYLFMVLVGKSEYLAHPDDSSNVARACSSAKFPKTGRCLVDNKLLLLVAG